MKELRNVTTERIVESMSPMVEAVRVRVADSMRSRVAWLDEVKVSVSARITAHAEKNDGAIHPIFARMAGIRTVADALASVETITDPYTMASFKFCRNGQYRQHSHFRGLVAEANRIAKLTPEQLEAEALEAGKNYVRRFASKIADKVDAVGVVTSSALSGSTVDSFTLTLGFSTNRLLMLQTRVRWNVSNRGTEFPQWPTLIYERGARVTETELKATK